MKTLIALILLTIFSAIALVHIYWALGGKKWGSAAIPTSDGTTPLFTPRAIDSLAVAFGFMAFMYIVACEAGFLLHQSWFVKYGAWAIVIIFLARAIGEFKYVGFFKKIKHTPFAINDSRFYTPLCLIISLFALIIKLL